MNTEPKALETKDGYEVYSNDGKLKIILRKTTSYIGAKEQEIYSTVFYIKDGKGWQHTISAHSYRSKKEFLDTLCDIEEFSLAAKELTARASDDNDV